MRILLFLLSVIAFLAGLGILVYAKSAIHEIEGFMLFLISAVCFSGAAIVESINLMKSELVNHLKNRSQFKNDKIKKPVEKGDTYN